MFAGELVHTSAYLPKNLVALESSALDVALAPLYLRQDTLNQFADYYVLVGETLDAPLEGYRSALDRASLLSIRRQVDGAWPSSLYNLTGSLLATAGALDLGNYGARAADVEGVRRAALAAVMLRSAAAQDNDVAAILDAGELRNPYDGAPLLWDAATRAVVFRGLQQGDRGEHRLFY